MALGSRGYPMKQVFSFPMNRRPHRQKLTPLVLFTAAALIGATHYARAQAAKVPELTVLPQSYGPYSGTHPARGNRADQTITSSRSDCESERALDNVCLG